MIHQVVFEIWVFRMGSTILEHPVYLKSYFHIFVNFSKALLAIT